MTLQPAIYPLIIMAAIMLAISIEDYFMKSIKTWRSYCYEVLMVVAIAASFYINWEGALVIAIIGIAFYLAAIPAIEKLVKDRYNYLFYPLDKQVFLLTLIGWPFISLFAFLGNQVANMVYNICRNVFKGWGNEMPQLVVYGVIWFLIAMAVLVFYIR